MTIWLPAQLCVGVVERGRQKDFGAGDLERARSVLGGVVGSVCLRVYRPFGVRYPVVPVIAFVYSRILSVVEYGRALSVSTSVPLVCGWLASVTHLLDLHRRR